MRRISQLCRGSWRKMLMSRRRLLTAAYGCDQPWNERLGQVPLSNVDTTTFLANAQKKVVAEGTVDAPTLDMAASLISDVDDFGIVKSLVYKLRHSRECHRILESTQRSMVTHAIRLGLESSLLAIIEDPINFGVFPDEYSVNILIDHLLKTKQYEYAARVGVYVMKQELTDNKLTCALSLLACCHWISEREFTWQSLIVPEAATSQHNPDEDETYFKVPFVKNHMFDDHFDESHPVKLVGKTMAWNARELPPSHISLNAQFMGWLLYDDENRAKQTLEKLQQHSLCKDLVQLLPPNAKSKEESETCEIKQSEETEDWKTELLEQLKSLPVGEHSLLDGVMTFAEEMVNDQADKQIKPQIESFSLWTMNLNRLIRLKREIEEKRLEKSVLANELSELDGEEELLTFFDIRDEWEEAVPPQLLNTTARAKIDVTTLTDEHYAHVIPDPSRYKQKHNIYKINHAKKP